LHRVSEVDVALLLHQYLKHSPLSAHSQTPTSSIYILYATASLLNCSIPQYYLLYGAHKDQLDHHSPALQRWKKIFSLKKAGKTPLLQKAFIR